MKIGVFGGTFNPPHLGHKNVIISALKSLNLDKILVIPNNLPPHKQIDDNSPLANDRLYMCKLLCEDIPKTCVLDIEVVENEKNYTINTLEKLSNIYKNDELFLLIGMDSFINIKKWYKFEQILKLSTLAVFKRDETEVDLNFLNELQEKFNAKIIIVNADVVKISSTDIRQLCLKGKTLPKIYDFIVEKNFY